MFQDRELGDEIVDLYTGDNLMNVLDLVQSREGNLSEEALLLISQKLDVPLARVHSAASFYAFNRFHKGGKHQVRVCECLSCHLNGSDHLLKTIERLTGVEFGESNEKFSLEKVQCIGCCDQAPAMLFDGEVVSELTEDKLKEMIKSC